MVKVTSLIVKAGSRLRFSFGVRAWTELEIRCIKGMYSLKLVSCENNSGRQNSTSFQPLQCHKNGACIQWSFVLRLYTTCYIVPLCGHLLVPSRHCHVHAASLSRALYCFCFKIAYNYYVGTYLASLLTILGTLHKPSRGVSKITTDRLRRFLEVNSIIRHMFGIGQPSVHTAVT